MSDDERSEMRHIETRLRLWFGHKSGYWGCKDAGSVFLYANEEYGRIIGLKHHLDVVDRTDFDMPCDTVACAQAFRDQDQEVMVTGKAMRILDIHPFAGGEWKAYLTTKQPLYDESGEVAGTVFHGKDITSPIAIELGTLLGRIYTNHQRPGAISQGSYRVGECGPMRVDLTLRESEVLFFLIRGQVAKSIAAILDVSVRTVEDHISTLRYKFSCDSKASLIEQAIYLGYLSHIPKTLFNRQLSLILRDC